MSAPNAPPCLFLSHSGADTDDARELKRRLLDSPDARGVGLRVWLDKDDLVAGVGWQAQLEKAISEDATAFAVHVGAKGIVNWVESEVRLGLSRATGAPNYPFIPILAKECVGSAALPPFARQYQGVRDPLNDPDEFARLLRAVLRRSPGDKAVGSMRRPTQTHRRRGSERDGLCDPLRSPGRQDGNAADRRSVRGALDRNRGNAARSVR